MTDTNDIKPGNVYKYRCDNNQSYGYMVPVRTSNGWDFIDTYFLDMPSRKSGETNDEASIRRIIELGSSEHDRYVSRLASSFYYNNIRLSENEVPCDLRLVFNLNDYNVVSRRDCDDYDSHDVIRYVPLYFEQHYDWDSGRSLGLCFVRKNAEKSLINEFRSLWQDVSRSIVEPYAEGSDLLLDKAKKKLLELEDKGLATPKDKAITERIEKRIEIIVRCREALRNVDKEYLAKINTLDSSHRG